MVKLFVCSTALRLVSSTHLQSTPKVSTSSPPATIKLSSYGTTTMVFATSRVSDTLAKSQKLQFHPTKSILLLLAQRVPFSSGTHLKVSSALELMTTCPRPRVTLTLWLLVANPNTHLVSESAFIARYRTFDA